LLGDHLTVVLEFSLESLYFTLVDNEESIAKSTEEILIVTNHHQTTFKVIECNNESIDGIKIKMVSRLIQEQDVRLLPRDHGEGDTRLLTSRQKVHGTKRHVANDTEGAEMGSELVGWDLWVADGELFHS
jgi:hypothetical protein